MIVARRSKGKEYVPEQMRGLSELEIPQLSGYKLQNTSNHAKRYLCHTARNTGRRRPGMTEKGGDNYRGPENENQCISEHKKLSESKNE